MDLPEYNKFSVIITGSDQAANITNTVNNFRSRALNSSFAATYFPDVNVSDANADGTGLPAEVICPPSVAVLGSFSKNDTYAPWFAPAGYTRGSFTNRVLSTVQSLEQSDADVLYPAGINPIKSYNGSTGPIIWGQKTLLASQSALNRINVRRLLIEVRRRVRAVANNFVFEPNRASTLTAFSAQVTPILAQIQQGQGIDKFSVRIDTSTTTQADIENNTIRGKIFVQPKRSTEFISIDFNVTNAGAQI